MNSNNRQWERLDVILAAIKLSAEFDLEQSLTHAQRNGIAALIVWLTDKAQTQRNRMDEPIGPDPYNGNLLELPF